MLKDFAFSPPMLKSVYQEEAEQLKDELAGLQQTIKENKLPVMVVFEGFSASGKGSCISQTILTLDPRFFKVFSITAPNDVERREPMLWRYWNRLPAQGQIHFYDRSWYQEIANDYVERQEITSGVIRQRAEDIRRFERQLTDGGTLIIKFFIHITKKEQKRRLETLSSKKSTAWRVTARDWKRNKQYDEYLNAAEEMLEETNYPFAPWHVVDGMDKRVRTIQIYRTLVSSIREALARQKQPKMEREPDLSGFRLIKRPKLSEVRLDKTIDPTLYHRLLEEYQERLHKCQDVMYLRKIPAVVVFEGWDAAGKGGAIKRVSASLDARSYAVNPVAAPNSEELAHHYLWRFWRTLPKDGHFAMYDRSWYGRVMVERIENITSPADWKRAYREINEFEQHLYDWGCVVVKFWMQIDRDTQLQRFTERQSTPAKRWKITDEDWRNREKWDAYETAVDEMIRLTSTDFAPWQIIEANDKLYARIRVLELLEDALTQHLKRCKKAVR